VPQVLTAMRFNRQFQMQRFELNISAEEKQFLFACDFDPQEIRCAMDGRNKGEAVHSAGRASVRLPYTFLSTFFGISHLVDFAWFYSALVRDVVREPGRETEVTLFDFDDGDGQQEMKVFFLETARVKYVGREEIPVAGKLVQGHKYEVLENMGESTTVWTSDLGLLLVSDDRQGMRFELTEYKESRFFLSSPR